MTEVPGGKPEPIIRIESLDLSRLIDSEAFRYALDLGDVGCVDGRATSVVEPVSTEPGCVEYDEIAKGLLDATAKVFDAEHQLLEPPKPIKNSYLINDFPRHYCENYESEIDPNYVPPTLEQIIKNLEEAGPYRTFERPGGNKRVRDNFGQEFQIVTKFGIRTETYTSKIKRKEAIDAGEEPEPVKHDPFDVAELANRTSIYRYLQQLGLVLIDDTGLSAYANSSNTYQDLDHGLLLLPASIDKEVFYEFEDEVRKAVPCDMRAIRLEMFKREREEGRKIAPEETIVPETLVRELVDYLATDERFVGMFEQKDALQAARKAQRRAEVQTD